MPRLLTLLALLATPMFADLRIVIRHTVYSTTYTTTTLLHNCLKRVDSAGRSHLFVSEGQMTVLDHARREYWQAPTHCLLMASAGPTPVQVVQIEIHPTGLQKQMWGHLARQYTIVQRRMANGNSPERSASFESWYLDIPSVTADMVQAPVYLTHFSLSAKPEWPYRLEQKGETPKGLLVRREGEHLLDEVTDLSEAPLDPKIFQVPPDYRRIIRPLPGQTLSWDDRLLYYWQQVEGGSLSGLVDRQPGSPLLSRPENSLSSL